jgi:hypothetical protein
MSAPRPAAEFTPGEVRRAAEQVRQELQGLALLARLNPPDRWTGHAAERLQHVLSAHRWRRECAEREARAGAAIKGLKLGDRVSVWAYHGRHPGTVKEIRSGSVVVTFSTLSALDRSRRTGAPPRVHERWVDALQFRRVDGLWQTLPESARGNYLERAAETDDSHSPPPGPS